MDVPGTGSDGGAGTRLALRLEEAIASGRVLADLAVVVHLRWHQELAVIFLVLREVRDDLLLLFKALRLLQGLHGGGVVRSLDLGRAVAGAGW